MPKPATVAIGNEELTETRVYRRKTARGSLLVFLYPGTYRVRVEKPGFVSTPEYSIDISKGVREVLTADLVPQPQLATLSLRGATPGAEVRIDGERVGEVSPDGGRRQAEYLCLPWSAAPNIPG